MWKHFKIQEFTCRCGCGGNEMQTDFVDKLDDLRERMGFALVVTSGYRCPAHNDSVSTTGLNGPHTTGRAVDFLIMGSKAHRLVQQCSLGGWFSGIGINQRGAHDKRFIHLDDLTERHRPNIWSY